MCNKKTTPIKPVQYIYIYTYDHLLLFTFNRCQPQTYQPFGKPLPYGAQRGRLFTWLEILPLALLAVRTACCTSSRNREPKSQNSPGCFTKVCFKMISLIYATQKKLSNSINSCQPPCHEKNRKSSINFLKKKLVGPAHHQSIHVSNDTLDMAKTQEWLS